MMLTAFQPRASGTTWRREIVAGTTAFATMAYIIVESLRLAFASALFYVLYPY